ncbi:ABC-three component system middle component 8 [Commensalibacter melissae]|uniref:ABC-three component system middle component 8 n=1 Tax=Commensalibacter melissae TaxID=2070537 RepID=UPI0012D87C54|nr:ABC-three component system middle component 8 [Commensalibacter melissae]MUH05832.1 hypothetical protein [Commensalibacter melissae]
MLIPTKQTNPDWTVLNIVLLLLKLLKSERLVDFDHINEHVKNRLPECEPLVLSALDFLYLFDKVEYYQETDQIEYKGK